MRVLMLVVLLSGCLPSTYRSYGYPAVGPYAVTQPQEHHSVRMMREAVRQAHELEIARTLAGK